MELVRAAGAVSPQFLNHLPAVVITCPRVSTDILVFEMLTQSVQAAAVITQLLNIVSGLGDEVAIKQIRFLVVDPDVKLARALSLEPFDRGISVHRIEFIRLNIAKQSFARVAFGVVCGSEKVPARNLAFKEECGRAGCVSIVPCTAKSCSSVSKLSRELVGRSVPALRWLMLIFPSTRPAAIIGR